MIVFFQVSLAGCSVPLDLQRLRYLVVCSHMHDPGRDLGRGRDAYGLGLILPCFPQRPSLGFPGESRGEWWFMVLES